MSETVSRANVFCEAHNCQLKPVMAGQCIFHSRIEHRYWPEVTRFLNSPEGAKVIAKSRKNRMLWALGTYNELEKFHPSDEHEFNTHEALKDVLDGLKRHNAIPEGVDVSDIKKVAKELTRMGLETGKPYERWTLYDICAQYERLLVNYVAERAGKKE